MAPTSKQVELPALDDIRVPTDGQLVKKSCFTPRELRKKTNSPSKPESIPWMLNPTSEFMKRWDTLMIVLLGFVSFVTPYEVAFLETKPDALFVINRFVDLGFIIDMVFQFFLPYYDNTDMYYVWNKEWVALNYLTSWFPIDFVSILPYDFMGGDPFAEVAYTEEPSDSATGQLKILRMVRLLRLIKLARVIKSARIFTRLQNEYELSFIFTYMLQLAVLCLILMHWFACIWGLASGLEGNPTTWITGGGMNLASLGNLYLGAFEFALMALVNGFGDFTPHNQTERALSLTLMIIGSCVYGYAIGEICDKTGNLNPAEHEYRQNMDLLNQYMDEIKFPPARKASFRQFFAFNKTNFKNRFFVENLMDHMSPDLQRHVARLQHEAWMSTIPFFNGPKHERNIFLSKMALLLEAMAFTPGEEIYCEGDLAKSMFIVQQGLCATKGFVISAGNYFGEDFVLPNGRRDSTARALTYTATYALPMDTLEEMLEESDLKATKKLIRKEAIRLAVKRTFMRILAVVRMQPTYKPMDKEAVEQWKQLNQAKTVLKRHNSSAQLQGNQKHDEEQDDTKHSETERANHELDFWLKGHVTGAEKPTTATKKSADLDECLQGLSRRADNFELNIQRLKTMVRNGVEQTEQRLEAQYRVFEDVVRRIDRAEQKQQQQQQQQQ